MFSYFRRATFLFLALIGLMPMFAMSVVAEPRIALVVGNGAYQSVQK